MGVTRIGALRNHIIEKGWGPTLEILNTTSSEDNQGMGVEFI